MPEFNCPECDESFNSRQKREEHLQATHGTDERDVEPLHQRLGNALTDKKKLAALVFGLTMIGLPFGGALFYSTVGPSTSGGGGGTGNTYTSTPPVGYSIRQLPRPDGTPPTSAVVQHELSDAMQVYLLVRGGPQQIGRRGLKPAVLLQYSCTDCPGTVNTLTSVASEINQGSSPWIYVAPYTEMNSTVAVSGFRQVERYDSVNRSQVKATACRFLQQQPLSCIADEFGGNTSQ